MSMVDVRVGQGVYVTKTRTFKGSGEVGIELEGESEN